MLRIPTLEERDQNKNERAEIIDCIMQMQSTTALHNLRIMARTMMYSEAREKPMALNEFVDMLDLPMIVKISELFKDESEEYMASGQIKELLRNAMCCYMGIEEEAKTA